MQDADERAELRIVVRHRADAIAAAAMVKALVHRAGGSAVQASRVATATTELAQNIVSHAGGEGEVRAWLERGDVIVRARDTGGSDAVAPTRGGLGQGKAAVARMMERVDFETTVDGGLLVTARLRIDPDTRPACG